MEDAGGRKLGVLSAPRDIYTGLAAPVPRFRLLGDFLMSLPRDRGHDLSLEPLGDRDGLRRAHLGEAAQVRTLEGAARSVERYSAAYQALIDAVFTAPGVTEWLSGLRRRVAAILGDQDAARHTAVARDAIRPAEPGPGRY